MPNLTPKDERLQERIKSRSSKTQRTMFKEDSRLVDNVYQPPSPPRRDRREHVPRETRVDLPHFHGKNDVEEYLEWDMKVEQLFSYHQVNEEGKVSLAILRVCLDRVF